MHIALIGGTGKEGLGLGVRWTKAGHRVAIGSRDTARARTRAEEIGARCGSRVLAGDNLSAAAEADVIVLCVPYAAHEDTVRQLAPILSGQVVIDITVPLRPPDISRVHLPQGQAAALEAQRLLGDRAAVVAALHHVSSIHLAGNDEHIDCDVLVCTDDPEARRTSLALVHDLGMKGLDAGPLVNAIALESFTPILLHLNKQRQATQRSGAGVGLRITGV